MHLASVDSNPSDAMLTARCKDLPRAALRDAGAAAPSFTVAPGLDEVLEAADAIGHSVVAKPSSGADSRLTAIVRDHGRPAPPSRGADYAATAKAGVQVAGLIAEFRKFH